MLIVSKLGLRSSFLSAAVFISQAFLTTSYASVPSETTKSFKVEGGTTIHANVPKDWEAITDYLGTPLSLLSKPGDQNRRTVVQVIPYGVKDTEDYLEKIQKDPEEYYSQKEEYLDGIDGQSYSYEPFTKTKINGATIYSIGVKYKNPLGEYHDQTFYISTNKKELYFVKALVPLDRETVDQELVEKVVNEVSAKN